MPDDKGPNDSISILLGGIVAVALVAFVLSSGEFGKKKIQSDADMPPISSPEKNFR
jgi:hypothetical protein